MQRVPITLVEVEPFPRRAQEVWSQDELDAFKDYIARNPEAGALIPGTGGVRKVRWASSGRGKRGGARVIYYYYSEEVPLFLLTIYAKNVADDLTPKQKQVMSRTVTVLIEQYGRS